jgi:hypothetical protein
MGIFGPSARERELERQLSQILDSQLQQQNKLDQARQEKLVTDFHADIQVVAGFIEPLKKIGQEIGQLQLFIDGLQAMAKAAADQLDEFKKVVDILERSMSHQDETDYSEYAEETPEGKLRLQRAEVRELIRQGIPEDQARARLRERDIYQELGRNRR